MEGFMTPQDVSQLLEGTTRPPWSVGSKGYNISGVYSGEDGIASVFGVPMHTAESEIPSLDERWHEGLANARLLAAAPDLARTVISQASTIEKLREALAGTCALIERMQDVVREFLPPDSDMTNQDALNRLIGLLDGPEQRAVRELVEATRPALSDQGMGE